MILIIDINNHPIYIQEGLDGEKELKMRKSQYCTDKQGVKPAKVMIKEMDYNKVDLAVLLPEAISNSSHDMIITNEQIKKIVACYPQRFVGFASVDPRDSDASEQLEYCFTKLGLAGLHVHTSKLKIYPNDPLLKKLYRICLKYNKPVIFHSGLTWQKDAPMKYSKPLNFEDVALEFPDLRIDLSHFGWPWTHDVIALLLKYPNVYTDISILQMDNAEDFYHQVFQVNMGPLWIERNLRNKVMFGTNAPRQRATLLLPAFYDLGFRKLTNDKILYKNALRFLGKEDQYD